jgi:hypothetical protein
MATELQLVDWTPALRLRRASAQGFRARLHCRSGYR